MQKQDSCRTVSTLALDTSSQPLVSTKLRQPPVSRNLVHRPRLKGLLTNGLDSSLVLVAAPAGFGKSTLVSAWQESCGLPFGWISLDEADNDLGVFLAYFLGAIQTLFPDALAETQAFLTGISLPSVTVIANSLINELDGIEHDFILVLDDYHLINEQTIHELLSHLLQHPPQSMHLVIVTRQDPPLPLGVMRARDQVVEVRGQDLRFSRDEIAEFVKLAIEISLPDDALDVLTDRTEGWAAGLRLATLTLRYSGDVDSHLADLAANRYVTDYMMHEVLSHVPQAMMSFLLRTSILKRMCNSLCAEVIGSDDSEHDSQENLVWLEQANMFTISLDSHGEWYRYHHLFQELLREQLTRQAGTAEIDTLHTRASAWYGRHGSLEEALKHALQGHNTPAAVHLVEEHRQTLMNCEQWQLFERIFNMFPAETVECYPELLLMAAHVAVSKNVNRAYIIELLDRAESLLAQMVDQSAHAIHLRGEIDAFRAIFACEAGGDPEKAVAVAQRALSTLPLKWYYMRAVAWLWLSIAYQMTGKLDLAYATLAQGQPEDVTPDGSVHVRVASARYFIEWIAGDLQAIPQGARHMLAVSETHRRRDSQVWAYYLLGSVAYEHNDLMTAEAHARAAQEMRYLGRPMAYLQSAFIDASICQARGLVNESQQKLKLAFNFLSETSKEGFVPLVQAFQAELAARQGDLGAARHWAMTIGPFLPLTPMPYFYAPQLTLPKILLAQDTSASLVQAAEVLSRLHAFVTATHNTRFTIEVLALQAMLHDAQGDERTAQVLLHQAVSLAEPGGFIRLFVDLGPRLASLLTRLRQKNVAEAYMDQILQAFGENSLAFNTFRAVESSLGRSGLVEPLTDREFEVLALLAQRLSNKEIAQALVISPQTVKRHATNIYGKLHATGRRDAVAKAVSLGLL